MDGVMRYVITLDPGLAITGWALWRRPVRTVMYEALPKQLVQTGSLRAQDTQLSDDLRHAMLVGQLLGLMKEFPAVELGFIERPAIAFQYARNNAGDRSGRGHATAEQVHRNVRVGGLLAGALLAGGAAAEFIPADTRTKEKRERELGFLGITAKNEHERDAVAIGVRTLSDWSRKWS